MTTLILLAIGLPLAYRLGRGHRDRDARRRTIIQADQADYAEARAAAFQDRAEVAETALERAARWRAAYHTRRRGLVRPLP